MENLSSRGRGKLPATNPSKLGSAESRNNYKYACANLRNPRKQIVCVHFWWQTLSSSSCSDHHGRDTTAAKRLQVVCRLRLHVPAYDIRSGLGSHVNSLKVANESDISGYNSINDRQGWVQKGQVQKLFSPIRPVPESKGTNL